MVLCSLMIRARAVVTGRPSHVFLFIGYHVLNTYPTNAGALCMLPAAGRPVWANPHTNLCLASYSRGRSRMRCTELHTEATSMHF
jgi:hypothetical protein